MKTQAAIGSGSKLETIDYATPPPLRRSVLGIASFIVSISVVATFVAVFWLIIGRPVSDPRAHRLLLLTLVLPIIGTMLGIVSMCQRRRYRGLVLVGLAINVLLILFVLLIIVPDYLQSR